MMPRAISLLLIVSSAAAAEELLGSALCVTPDCVGFDERAPLRGDDDASNDDNWICPQHIGDSCPRFYNNTMADYSPGDSLAVEPALVEFMNATLATYLELVATNYPPSRFDSADVFGGVGGRAVLYLRLYARFGRADDLALAAEYIDAALARVDSIETDYVGMMWGRTGVYAVGAVVADLTGNATRVAECVDAVRALFEGSVDDSFAAYDDFDAGRAGLLYSARYLEVGGARARCVRCAARTGIVACRRRSPSLQGWLVLHNERRRNAALLTTSVVLSGLTQRETTHRQTWTPRATRPPRTTSARRSSTRKPYSRSRARSSCAARRSRPRARGGSSGRRRTTAATGSAHRTARRACSTRCSRSRRAPCSTTPTRARRSRRRSITCLRCSSRRATSRCGGEERLTFMSRPTHTIKLISSINAKENAKAREFRNHQARRASA